MPPNTYQIRLCTACGLRYPLVENHPFGERCPSCLGTTELVSSHRLDHQPAALATKQNTQFDVLLDNVRSAWNVGSIFRTADGLGASKIYLCGITPTPENESVQKTALGAENTVTWNYSRNALETATELKLEGHKLIALEQDERSTSLGDLSASFSFTQGKKLILILGNEVTGVDPALLDLCDQIVQIPMRGQKRSLNVEVAFAIAAHHILCE